MRMLGYYLFHSFINQIKKLCKSWFIIFLLVCMLMGGAIGFITAMVIDNNEVENETEETQEVEEMEEDPFDEITSVIDFSELDAGQTIELGLSGAIALILILQIINADKSGGKLFLPADTTLLFAAPLKPQSVLLFRLFARAGTWVFTFVYLLTFMPTWLSQFDLSFGTLFVMISAIVYAFLFGNFLMVMFYTYLASNPNRKKTFNMAVYAVLFCIAASFLLYQRNSGYDLLLAASHFFNHPITRFIPIWGWLKGIVAFYMQGNIFASLACFIACVLLNIFLVYFIWHMNADFYEEAQAKSQETAQLQELMQSENVGFVKRKKDRSEKIRRDAFGHGYGSTVFFYRTMYNRLRFAPLGIFTKTTLTYLGVTAALFVLSKLAVFVIDIDILILILGGFVFYRTLGDAWAEDASKDFFRMIPTSTSSKIFYSLLGGSVNCLLDLLPALLLACILFTANPLIVLGWIPFILSIHFYGIAVNAFLYVVISPSIGATVKQIIQISFLYFGLLPAIAIIAFGYVNDWFIRSIIIATCVHIALAALFIYFTALSLEPGEKSVLPAKELTEEERKQARKVFSRIGTAFVLFLALSTVFQIVLGTIFFPFTQDPIWMWVINFTPLYLVAFPLTALFLKKLPSHPIKQKKLRFLQLLKIFFISYAFIYAGSYIGNLITTILASLLKVDYQAGIETLATAESVPMKFLVMVILAPIIEETLCRKLVIEKTVQYGERNAILLSGLLFGLFHGNFTQFFYAFFLGIIFAYVYTRTGKLRYTIGFHMVINFLGSIVSTEILKTVDPATNLSPQYIAYLIVILCFSITGLILWLKERKHLVFHPAESELSKKDRKLIYFNPGMITFYIVTGFMFVSSMFSN